MSIFHLRKLAVDMSFVVRLVNDVTTARGMDIARLRFKTRF